MTAQTKQLLNVTNQTGAVQSGWFQAKPPRGRTHVPFHITISGTSASVTIEGRNSQNDTAVNINSAAAITATDAFLAQHFEQYRVNVTAATAANIRVTTDEPMRSLNAAGDGLA